LIDIDNSNLIVANVHRSAGRGTGTSMEIMYAWMKQKPIILWHSTFDEFHPFYESMHMMKHGELADVADSIRKFK